MKVLHHGLTVGFKFVSSATAGSEGAFQRKGCREYAQCTWASCDAMEPDEPLRGFRARWQARATASEASPKLDGDDADGWEEVGLEAEEDPGPAEPAAELSEMEAQERLDAINAGLQRAVEQVTPEELETYWSVLPPGVKELVSMNGEVSADLLAYVADTDQERMDIMRQYGCPEHEVVEKATVLEALQLTAEEKVARLRRNRIAKRGAQMAVDMAAKAKMHRQRVAGELKEGEVPTKTWLEKHSGAILMRCRRRSTDVELDAETAETVKQREQHQWEVEAEKVVDVLEENADLPIVRGAGDSRDPREYLKAAVGAYRASTLRKRLREWKKFLTWLEIVHQVRWPSRRAHAIDYLVELRLSEAPPTVPQSFGTTLAFFEKAAGIGPGAAISSDVAFRRALDMTNKEMEQRKPEKKQAPLLPLKVIAAMEMLVVSPSNGTFVRFSAWCKLVKIWTASRTDDLQGISLKTMKFTKAGLFGVFWKTKVSGPGKKNKILPFMVSRKVSITGLPWLETGMRILEDRYWYPRDYLVPVFPCGLEDIEEKRPATYDDFVVMTRVVYSRLKECSYDDGRWVSGRGPLLLPELYKLWTEHSERNWIVSMAASAGIPREERQMLGRWAVKESGDEYVRSAQRIVARIQCSLLDKLRSDTEWDLKNSGLEEVKDHIVMVKYDEESIRRQMWKLEMPEVWTPVDLDDPALPVVERPPGVEVEEVAKQAPDPPAEVPSIKELMDEKSGADDVGSEEDDIDVQGKFFVAINVRNRHRKLHIWGKCGTKPGQNFAAYEPHDSLKGVKFNSICGHCWKGKDPMEAEDSSTTSSSSNVD